jgi:hypothetical protein
MRWVLVAALALGCGEVGPEDVSYTPYGTYCVESVYYNRSEAGYTFVLSSSDKLPEDEYCLQMVPTIEDRGYFAGGGQYRIMWQDSVLFQVLHKQQVEGTYTATPENLTLNFSVGAGEWLPFMTWQVWDDEIRGIYEYQDGSLSIELRVRLRRES